MNLLFLAALFLFQTPNGTTTTVLPNGRQHHSYSALYDISQRIALKGALVSFEWKTPTVSFTIAVDNSDGTKTLWQCEGTSLNSAFRQGWTRDVFEEMQQRAEILSIDGAIAKDGSKRLAAIEAKTSNGRSLSLMASPTR